MVTMEEEWTYHGYRAIFLQNNRLRVVILPQLGGKVLSIDSLQDGRRLLWLNPARVPHPVATGASFDDNFLGGWDVLFPNDLPEELGGEPYPDHGELWTASWTHHPIDAGTVLLKCQTPISGCRITRRISLDADEATIVVTETVTNLTRTSLPYLWKQHLALSVTEGDRVLIPEGSPTLMGDFGAPRAGRPGHAFSWPMSEGTDMAPVLPKDSGTSEFYFVTDLLEGTIGLSYADDAELRVTFERSHYPSCWVFASFGAWRATNVLILEPCTGYPLEVAAGVRDATHRVLPPEGEISLSLTLTYAPTRRGR